MSTIFQLYDLPWPKCVARVSQQLHEKRRILTYSLKYYDVVLMVHKLLIPPEILDFIIDLTIGLEEWCEIDELYEFLHCYQFKKVLDDLWSDLVLHNLDGCCNSPQAIRIKYMPFLSAIELHAFSKELIMYRSPHLSFAQSIMRRLYAIRTKQKYWMLKNEKILQKEEKKRIKAIIMFRQDKELVNWLLDLVGFVCSGSPISFDMHFIINNKASLRKKIGK